MVAFVVRFGWGRTDPKIPRGSVGAAKLIRQWAMLSQQGDVVDIESFDPTREGDIYLGSVDLEVRLPFTLSLSFFIPLRASELRGFVLMTI